MDAAIIRQGELVGRGIMAYETTEEVGAVEHLLVDVKQARVIGLLCKTAGLIGRKQSLSWSQIVKIGKDRLVVQMEPVPNLVAASEAQLAAAQNMTGLEVWTDGGDHLGQVVDLCVNQATGEVQQYLFILNHPPRAEADGDAPMIETPPVYTIEPQMIISAGRKRMMIAEEDAQRSRLYPQPITIISSSPAAARQRPEIPTELGELVQGAQSIAGNVTKRVKQFTHEQIASPDFIEADSLPDITEQLKAKTEQVKQQLGKTSFGRSLGQSLSQTLDRFKRPQVAEESIDVEAFEVWEEDE